MTVKSAVLPLRRLTLWRLPVGVFKIWLLTAVLASIAVLLVGGAVVKIQPVPAPFAIPWWVLAIGFYLAETNVVHLEFRRQAHTFSLSEIPFVVGLIFVSPLEFVLANVVGSAVGLIVRRQSPIKFCFNLSHFALEATVAVIVFDRLNGHALEPGAQLWLAAFATTAVVNVIGILAISLAIGFAEGRWQRERLPEVLRFGLSVGMTNTSLALIGVTILWLEPAAAWLLAIPIGLMLLAYRTLMSEREKNKSLEFLYESTRILQRSPELDAAVADLLGHARTMFRAGTARLVLMPSRSGEAALETVIGPGDERRLMAEVAWRPNDALVARALHESGAFLYERSATPDDPIALEYPEIGDAMVTALRGDEGTLGLLVIADRLGDVTSFVAEDLKLFETLANHAAMAFENGQLGRSLAQLAEVKEQLRYQAYHDVLTGLGNRALFLERLSAALEREVTVGAERSAILFFDLDDFKTVNDSLGHPAGDDLLRIVAARLRESVRAQDLAVRLGGDEFAILIGGTTPTEELASVAGVAARAVLIAQRILDALVEPIQVANTSVVIRGSIGIAVSRRPHDGAEALVRDADVAMYAAKANGKGGFVVFQPRLYTAVVRRHSLKADLQQAIDTRRFVLQYQPICHLETREAVALEALIRWRHPTRGLVSPTEFIPFAEESGLILPIGRWVIERGIEDARQWLDIEGGVAPALNVNVSARQIHQPDFVDEVAEVLEASDFPANKLTVEITETLMMQDVETMIVRLAALRSLGIKVALDDFGTGWSSMAWLREFPVDALKIPRELLGGPGASANDWDFTRAIVTLGHSLRLDVVAEGIEFADQLERLLAIGVVTGQGFFFSPPIIAKKVEPFIREARAATAALVRPPFVKMPPRREASLAVLGNVLQLDRGELPN